ncbi:MAG: hypothetical protein A3B11_01310 [Candidatus Taylorbacteria bacterium RIFCSPLOWO2_01_FULL_44_26]|uniref:Arsenite methyltransferase n=2 Tax=Candidatus Tayloriibacteriota TaxID=1817919 RepID=A0A1G2MLN7_9BACT|nr:MAG: hypothetical protein A3D50_01090 [Candidatus Taylorbacteria bacterium RIFCSPHIGHO2_02_FULL_44_12]OHA30954.1 MAG: hypothetical protein A3B11_01310 [Candidatus Taylorbacteria bacterium RIFCSPLOWO2_01_FULL_44_26]
MFSEPAANIAKLGLVEGMKVVDLGAGSGFYSIESGRRVGASGRVYAIDIQKDLLERLRSISSAQGIRNIEVIVGDLEKIGGTKLRESMADRVIASNILFQIEISKRDDFVLEIKRVLKTGGKVLVVDWEPGGSMSPKNSISSAETRILFEKNGFVWEQSFPAGDHHYGLILSR